jgi:hypothetical protein
VVWIAGGTIRMASRSTEIDRIDRIRSDIDATMASVTIG